MFIRTYCGAVRYWLLLTAGIFSGALGGIASEGLPGPLAEVIYPQLKPILERAMTQSPQMIQRNLDIAQAEASRISTRSVVLPNIGAVFSYSKNTSAIAGAANSSHADGVYYSVSASQPLFQWGTLKAQTASAAIGVLIAEKNFAEGYRLLANQIRAQYIALIVKKMNLRNAEYSLSMTKDALALQEERLRVGGISPGEILPSQLSVEESLLSRDRMAQDLDQALRFFGAMTGNKEFSQEQIPEEIRSIGEAPVGSARPIIANFMSKGVEETLQAQVYRHYLAQADLTYKVAKFRLFPKFSMSAGYGLNSSTSINGNAIEQAGVTSQSISISGSWSIFDGFATKGSKLSALVTKRNYQQQYENYLRSASEQVSDLVSQLEFAFRALKLAETRAAMQSGGLGLAKHQLEQGVGGKQGVDAAQQAYNFAVLSVNVARGDCIIKWCELLSALNQDPVMKNLPAKYLQHAK